MCLGLTWHFFLASLLLLLWDSALLYWDIPEANFLIGLQGHTVRGLLDLISLLQYCKCGAIAVFICMLPKCVLYRQACYFTTQINIVDNFLNRIKTFYLKQDIVFGH